MVKLFCKHINKSNIWKQTPSCFLLTNRVTDNINSIKKYILYTYTHLVKNLQKNTKLDLENLKSY